MQPLPPIRRRSPAAHRPAGMEKGFEADDPFELVGVRYPLESGTDEDREVARCFIEEYALMGWSAERIRRLFTSPRYTGPYSIRHRQGDEFIDGLIAEVFGSGGDA
ncbi:MAG: hypothetical protein ACE5KX_02285 [Acidimicrobiia bacterium]